VNINKKATNMLSTAVITALIAIAVNTSVSAQASAIDINASDGKIYEYQYDSLKASAVDEAINGSTDPSANLYNDFMKRRVSIAAYYDNVNKDYISFSTVATAAVNAITVGTSFDFKTFMESTSTPTITITPNTVTSDSAGNILINGQSESSQLVDMSSITCTNPIDNYSTTVTFKLNVTNLQNYNVTLRGVTATLNSSTGLFGAVINGKVASTELQSTDFVITNKSTSSAATITGINNINATVAQNASYTLPTTVSATMSDGSAQNVGVTWDKQVDTSQLGTFTFNGTVSGYSGNVVLTLTVQGAQQELSVEDIAKKGNSVVYVEVYDQSGKATASGSGFVISSDGKIVTNYHVINGAYSAKVTLNDGTKYDVQGVYGYDKTADIAILKVGASNLSSVTLADSSTVQLGQSVVAIGSPEGLQNTVSTGIISSIRTSDNRSGYKDFQISVPINHGSSGGALFNMYGQVIGITYAGYNTTGDLNFAIPIDDLNNFMNVSTLTTIAQVNGFNTSGNGSSTTGCFPYLSDVPQIPNVNYCNYIVNGNTVTYLYNLSDLTNSSIANYKNLLTSDGWQYYRTKTFRDGSTCIYYENNGQIIGIGNLENRYFAIIGNAQ
jgi:S1-C subfamily serine protease